MLDVNGKVAFVTGAASGIGNGIARALAGAGMKVMLADIEKPALDAAEAALAKTSATVASVVCDVSERSSVFAAADKTLSTFGKVHVVCNNAGVATGGLIEECSQGDWDWIIGVNYYAREAVHLDVFQPGMVGRGATPGAPTSDMGWEIYPEGIHAMLKEAGAYGLPLYVTENGVADEACSRRVRFLEDHVYWVRRAIAEGVALVVLSFIEPLSTVHLRQAVREVHRVAPKARIMIGIWRQRDPAMLQELQRRIHADALVTTLNKALAAALEMSGQRGVQTPAPRPAPRPAVPANRVEAEASAVAL